MATGTVGAVGPVNQPSSGVVPWLLNALKGVPSLVEGLPQGAAQTVAGAGQDIYNVGKALAPDLNIFKKEENLIDQPSSTPAAVSAPAITPPKATPPSPAATANDSLTYQQLMNQTFGPLISSLGYGNSTSINQALPGYPNAPAGPQSAAQSIANTQQVMVNDYKTGLNAMLSTAAEQAPIQALVKGMESLLAYPTTGLTGLYGAPPGVAGSSFLQSLYEQLSAERSGLLPSNAATNNAASGYNTSTLNAALNG